MNGKYRVPTLVKLVDSLCRAVDDEEDDEDTAEFFASLPLKPREI